MFDFKDEELIKQKALIIKIIESLSVPFEKLSRVCSSLAISIDELDQKMSESNDLKKIAVFSKNLDLKKNELIEKLAVLDRIEKILTRNKTRLKFVDKILADLGIYNDKSSKSDILKLELENINNIDDENLNLNVDCRKYKFFDGHRWLFENSKLNLSQPENAALAKTLTETELNKLIETYPSCVSTLTAEMLLDTKLKKNILKSIASYVFNESKTKGLKEINKQLGELLSFRIEIPESADGFVAGVQNLFAVMIKHYLIEKNPTLSSEIGKALNCNEKSELLPSSVKKIALANGLAGKIEKDEASESEEVRIQSEKEVQKDLEINQILDILGFDAEEAEEMAKLVETQKTEAEKAAKKHKELEELKNQKEADEEAMKMMQSLKKDID